MSSLLTRAGRLTVAIAALTFTAGRMAAQTPEGTVITNTATVTYTDANSNAYAPVSGSVSVTVGFTAGVSVAANNPTPTPASPSTANQLTFTITNAGNGTDSVTVSQNISVAGVITVTGYEIGASSYASLAALNLALSQTAIAQAGTVQIKVNYDVASNKGGVNTVYTLTAASRRTPATTANGQSSITPAQTYAVATTPDGGQNLQRLPGTAYSFTFTVQNNGNGSDQFDLLATSPGSVVISIVSVNGAAGDSTRVTLAAGASQTYSVVYNVATVAAGSTDTLYLKARSVGQPATLDNGFADLTVVKPNLTVSKQAFRDDGVTPVVGTVLPGEFIRYQVTITNNGSFGATSVQVSDALPAELTYASGTGTDWSFSVAGQTITADYTANGGVLAASSSSSFVLRVSVN
jgi:trimeric autotransporter adhesin